MRLQETKWVGDKGTESDTARVELWCTLRKLEVRIKLVVLGESGGSKKELETKIYRKSYFAD